MSRNITHDNVKNNEFMEIEGRNPVLEALRSHRPVNRIFIQKNAKGASINTIVHMAEKAQIRIQWMDNEDMHRIASPKCQGVIAFTQPFQYNTIDDIMEYASKNKQIPFILILDGIEDPHNLGSIIRTAECCGVHGVIIPERRAASITSTVIKTSAGAVEHMRVVRVTNIVRTIEKLKEMGMWVAGAHTEGQTYSNIDFSGSTAVVIGNEGKGISRLVKEKCDFLVSIPLKGRISSLNASVAAGVIMYEVLRQRSIAY